jgi:inner membrane protein
MPTIISHAVVAAAGGIAFAPNAVLPHFWRLAVLSSLLPDADVLAFSFGVPYHHFFGHRGFFHSPFFALLWRLMVVGVRLLRAGWRG